MIEAILEPLEENPDDDEVMSKLQKQRRSQNKKQLSGTKKRGPGQFDASQMGLGTSSINGEKQTDEDRKIMRNYLDEDTLDEEYKKAMNAYFGKKEKKG